MHSRTANYKAYWG